MGRVTRLAAIAALGAGLLDAKAGLAEWSVDTPGGNLICSCDHGMVGLLVHGQVVAGVPVWWQTYTSNHLAGYVQIGDPAGQYFLLNEQTGRMDWYPSRRHLQAEVARRGLWRTWFERDGPYLWESGGGVFLLAAVFGLVLMGSIAAASLYVLWRLGRAATRRFPPPSSSA